MASQQHYYFIGIGGISMSGLAQLLHSRGYLISGSDASASAQTEALEEAGIHVTIGQQAQNLTDAAQTAPIDAVIYTAAIHPDNPEYAEATQLGLRMMSRAELMGEIMTGYHLPVAVAGTHGKSTTTSMLSHLLLAADADPTLSIGALLPAIQNNIRIGHSDVFVTEACEYTNSFLSFRPGIAIILNIEEDHLDFFKDLADIRNSFRRFAQLLPPAAEGGALIINAAIPALDELTADLPCRIITFHTGQDTAPAGCDYYASDIQFDERDCASFCLNRCNGIAPDAARQLPVTLHVPGLHNIGNAIAAIATFDHLASNAGEDGTLCADPDAAIREGFAAFTGAKRRFEYKGEVCGVTVIDDYAHHPSEIQTVLNIVGKLSYRQLYLVFQPHTYTRTKSLFEDFARTLSGAWHVILAPIFAARETDTLGISSDLLAERICALGGHAISFSSFGEIEEYLLENCTKGDLLITVGAGDVYKIGEDLLGR